jgi:hypothetical protein
MAITGLKVVRSFVSMSILPGMGFLAMGLGAIPVPAELAPIAGYWVDPTGLPLKPVLVLLGLTKILSVLKLWGYGPMPKTLAYVGLGAAATCAAIAHAAVEGPAAAAPPVIYLALMAIHYHLESRSPTADEKIA